MTVNAACLRWHVDGVGRTNLKDGSSRTRTTWSGRTRGESMGMTVTPTKAVKLFGDDRV